MIDTIRRVFAVILTLALVFGPAVGTAYASLGGAKAAVMTASGDGHSYGKCDDCGAKGGVPAGPCSPEAFCGSPAIAPVTHFLSEELPTYRAIAYQPSHLVGRAEAPDPYPPRSSILS